MSSKKIISIIQPCFIPWLGYFEQIAIADIFVYMDDVQYTKKDWRNTNQLKTPNGVKKVYIPVQKVNRDTLINEALISYNEDWQLSFINKITQWYKKAPFFTQILDLLNLTIFSNYEKLLDLNYHLNNEILKYLEIRTPIYFSSEISKKTANRNSRIIELCKHFEEKCILYDGKSASSFIDLDLFSQNGIEVIFQDYKHSPYKQLWGDFVPYISIIDLLMNHGKESKDIILSSPLPDILN